MQKIDNIDLSLLIFSEFLTWRHQNVSVPVTMQTVVVATWFKNSTMFTRKKELPQAKDRKVTVGQISLADWSDRTKVHVWKLSVFFALRTSLIVSMTDVQIQTSHSYFSLLIEYQVTRGWSRLFVMSNVWRSVSCSVLPLYCD